MTKGAWKRKLLLFIFGFGFVNIGPYGCKSALAGAFFVGRSLASWGLTLTNAKQAWELTEGKKSVVVAIIDTGVDIFHPELEENIWTNPGESGPDAKGNNRATNGIDDDKNGFVDDVHGWNFIDNNNLVIDRQGHGTHIAGIIAAKGKNKADVKGVAPNTSLMILKYFDPKATGAETIRNTVRAIDYAIRMKARIINYSSGGSSFSQKEKQAIARAGKKGILFVAAAGNEGRDTDSLGYYPAGYRLRNIISVTAISKSGHILKTSNFGRISVDIAAPGKSILSTIPFGKFGRMTGTSQATAFVSGSAALLLSQNPEMKLPERMIERLTRTGSPNFSLIGKAKFPVTVDSYRALAFQERGINTFQISKEISEIQKKKV